MSTPNPQVLANTRAFLSRVDLKGGEVPAFADVINWLASFDPAPVVPASPAPKAPTQSKTTE